MPRVPCLVQESGVRSIVLQAPAASPPEERVPGTHWRGGRVNPRAGLNDL
jgi:hypothetical protein